MENKKIVVFGSYVTDLTGRTPKFPTEGETVMGCLLYTSEILGIGGLNECGMHELGKLIFGLEPRTIGDVYKRQLVHTARHTTRVGNTRSP